MHARHKQNQHIKDKKELKVCKITTRKEFRYSLYIRSVSVTDELDVIVLPG